MNEDTNVSAIHLATLHFNSLKIATAELLKVRNLLGPIYAYYLPQTWLRTIARKLRLTRQPDFAKHRNALQKLRDSAWQIIEDAKQAFESIAAIPVGPPLRQLAHLGYLQVYYDGNVVILLNEYVKAMDLRDERALSYGLAMVEMAEKARANLADLQRHEQSLQ